MAESKALTLQAKKYGDIREYLRARKSEIAAQAGDLMDPQRLLDLSLSVIRGNDKLLECSPQSLFAAVNQAARLGLEPTGRVGGAYLVPFAKEVQLITDYRGEITLCVRSGFCSTIKPVIVCENDPFEVFEGTRQEIIHTPDYKSGKRGKESFVYAIAKLVDSTVDFEVLDLFEIERRRLKSKLSSSGPWKTDYWRMALKSAVRALANRLVKSSVPRDRAMAQKYLEHVDREEAAEFGFEGQVIDVTAVDDPPPNATDDLASRLERQDRNEKSEEEWEAEQRRKFEEEQDKKGGSK